MNNTSNSSQPHRAPAVGIFGGTFDPVHLGHLILAELSREQLGLDTVLFVPALVPPHKTTGRKIAPGEERLRMLEIATSSNQWFAVSDLELSRGGISYTYDTLIHLRREHAHTELVLLIGADNAVDFSTWRNAAKIVDIAQPAVWARPGSTLPDELLPGAGYRRVDTPLIEISSTDIRRRVATGRSIRYLTPSAVAEHIYANGLYR